MLYENIKTKIENMEKVKNEYRERVKEIRKDGKYNPAYEKELIEKVLTEYQAKEQEGIDLINLTIDKFIELEKSKKKIEINNDKLKRLNDVLALLDKVDLNDVELSELVNEELKQYSFMNFIAKYIRIKKGNIDQYPKTFEYYKTGGNEISFIYALEHISKNHFNGENLESSLLRIGGATYLEYLKNSERKAYNHETN